MSPAWVEELCRKILAGAGTRLDSRQQRGLQLVFCRHLRQVTNEKRGFQTQECVELAKQLSRELLRSTLGLAHAAGSITAAQRSIRVLVRTLFRLR